MSSLHQAMSLTATAALVAISTAAPVAPAFAQADETKVHCYGINSCKGTSDCKTAKNDCKGLNDCKGQGFQVMTVKQCKAKGGSLTEAK